MINRDEFLRQEGQSEQPDLMVLEKFVVDALRKRRPATIAVAVLHGLLPHRAEIRDLIDDLLLSCRSHGWSAAYVSDSQEGDYIQVS